MRAVRRAIATTCLFLVSVFVPVADAQTFADNDARSDAHSMADIVRFAATYHGTRLDVDVVVQQGRHFGMPE